MDLKPLLSDIRQAYPSIEWEISLPEACAVRADSGMLHQILLNLVKNAVEAGADRVMVSGSFFTLHSSFMLAVSNNGQPIPAEARSSIFVPFFTTKRSGSGIGLPLSLRMMLAMNGGLELPDRPQPGYSVTFLLTFQ